MAVSGTKIRRALAATLTVGALTACASWTTPAMRGEPTPAQRDSARVAEYRADQAERRAGIAAIPATTLTFALVHPSRGDATLFGTNGIVASHRDHADGLANVADAVFLTRPGGPNGLVAVRGVGNVVVHQGTPIVPTSKGP